MGTKMNVQIEKGKTYIKYKLVLYNFFKSSIEQYMSSSNKTKKTTFGMYFDNSSGNDGDTIFIK